MLDSTAIWQEAGLPHLCISILQLIYCYEMLNRIHISILGAFYAVHILMGPRKKTAIIKGEKYIVPFFKKGQFKLL